MKKIIMFLLILATIPLFAQGSINGKGSNGQNYVSQVNSTSTPLGSSATFTGSWELCWDYSYISMVLKSNRNSAASGWKIQFSTTGSTATIIHEGRFTYTAGDSLTNIQLVGIAGSYYRVIYTNTNSAQATFLLETRLHARNNFPFTSDGKISVTVNGVTLAADSLWILNTILPPGASDTTKQNTQITRTDTTNARISRILTDFASGLIKSDSANARLSRLLLIDFATSTKQTELRDTTNSKWEQWFGKHWATYERQDSVIKHLSDQLLKQQETIDTLNILKVKFFALFDTLNVLKNKNFATENTLSAIKDSINVLKNKDFATQTTLTELLDSLKVLKAKDFATETTLATLKGFSGGFYGVRDSVTADTATVTFAGGTWVQGKLFVDDSCEVSFDSTFPSGKTWAITEKSVITDGSPADIPKWNLSESSILYIRRYGSSGTVHFNLRAFTDASLITH